MYNVYILINKCLMHVLFLSSKNEIENNYIFLVNFLSSYVTERNDSYKSYNYYYSRVKKINNLFNVHH